MSWTDWFWVAFGLVGLVKLGEVTIRTYTYYSTKLFRSYCKDIEVNVKLVNENLWRMKTIDGDDSPKKNVGAVESITYLLTWLDHYEELQDYHHVPWHAIGTRFARGENAMQIMRSVKALQLKYQMPYNDDF